MSSLPLSPRNNACASSPVRLVSTRPRIAQPLLVALALGASLGSVPAAHAANCVDNVPITTVGAGSCTIPAGVTSINVIAVGGGGGAGRLSWLGGGGARVTVTGWTVTAGVSLNYFIGGGGGGVDPNGLVGGGGGGGSTDVALGTAPKSIIAGGGGGAGEAFSTFGGAGGNGGSFRDGTGGSGGGGSTYGGGFGGGGGVGGNGGPGTGYGNNGGFGSGGGGGFGTAAGGSGSGSGSGGGSAYGGGGGGGYGGGGGGGGSSGVGGGYGGGGAGGSLGPPGITVYATALNPGVPRDNGGNGGNGSLTIQWTYTVTATPNPAAGGGRLVCTSITSPNVSGAAQISVGTSGTETVTCTGTPDAGYTTQSISGCGGTATGIDVNSYTTPGITANCTVTATFAPTVCRLDVNDDSARTPEIDGLLILRYLFGFRGNSLVNGLPPSLPGNRNTVSTIEAFLSGRDFNVRGLAQAANAQRDGLVILRYLQNPNAAAAATMIAGTDILSADATTVFNRLQSWCP